jgi:membrane-bound serine protease (ClpP class)
MLIDTDIPGYSIPWQLIFTMAALSAGFLLAVLHLAMRARSRPVVSGREQMIGASGEVYAFAEDTTFARIHGETWQVRSRAPLERGQKVRVLAVDGLLLTVEPVQQGDEK